MVEKAQQYWLGKILLPLLGFGGIVVLYGPVARSVVPRPAVPASTNGVLALAAGVGVGGYVFVAALEARALRAAGTQAGLSVDGFGLGLFGRPTLSGHRRGRPVEVRIVKDTDTASARRARDEKLFTVVATTLQKSTDTGLIVGRGDQIGSGTDRADPVRREENGVAVLSGVEGPPDRLLSGRSREAIAGVDLDSPIYLGDVSDIMLDSPGGGVTAMAYNLAESQLPASETTVVHKSKGLVFDGETLGRRVEAVVVVAEAFEGQQVE